MKQSSLLKRILSAKRAAVAEAKKRVPLQQLKEQLIKGPPTRNFRAAVTRRGAYDLRLIAELKKASPVKGVLRPKFDPAALAREFELSGAAALSVLTDVKFFQGAMENINLAKGACSLPVLRKDFIVDIYQLYESRLAGADAVLLIAQLLAQKKLKECIQTAMNLSLTPLVEVHTEA
jgi:indole-3-glycerol phosphate synthase